MNENYCGVNNIKNTFFLFFIFLPVLLHAQNSVDRYNTYLTLSNQVVFVTATDWKAIQGTMKLYQRAKNNRPWKLTHHFTVTLGRNGLGFDKQSVLPKPDAVVIKHEGDGKSPVGIFRLGPVFSYHPLKRLKMPFKKVDTTDICVDDVHSIYYNTMVNIDTASRKDWNSFEHMKANNESYEYGVWVKYNADKIFAGNGSCIFLHVWAGNTSPTAGCTAMEKQNIIKLIHWLDSKKQPVLLQIVEKE
jgi:L,D-peptidoglycan transpeptidase YkuD (ErfK/YbiS/YcfS/YnhG family)